MSEATDTDEVVIRSGSTAASVSTRGARVSQVRTSDAGAWFLPSQPFDQRGPVGFERGARAGWDECFPSIEAVDGVSDHGDLWHRQWRVVEHDQTRVCMALDDDRSDVRVEREVTLVDAGLMTLVRIENRSTKPVPYLYSAHPMFAWRSDATLDVPGGAELQHLFGAAIEWVSDDAGARVDLPIDGRADCVKYFVRWQGDARLHQDHGVLRISADARSLPWLGVCVNRRAWPAPEREQLWIALEPATAPTDSLDIAASTGAAMTLAAAETVTFSITATMR